MRGVGWVGVLLYFLLGTTLPMHGASPVESLVDRDLQPLPKPQPRWGRNPFLVHRTGDRGTVRTDKFALTAIISREGGGLAIINDQIVRQGDTIDGGFVTAIHADRVFVQQRGRIFELRVEPFGSK